MYSRAERLQLHHQRVRQLQGLLARNVCDEGSSPRAPLRVADGEMKIIEVEVACLVTMIFCVDLREICSRRRMKKTSKMKYLW